MVPHNLASALTLRAFWLQIGNLADERQQAKHQHHHHRQRRLDAPSVSPHRRRHGDPAPDLIGKVSAMISRLFATPPVLDKRPEPAVQEPSPRPSIIERVVDALTPEQPQPELTPTPPTKRQRQRAAY